MKNMQLNESDDSKNVFILVIILVNKMYKLMVVVVYF